ncbi:MAG: hypothetical protein ABL962_16185 [Fimbriimonadaceae bacterium]
MRHLFFGIAYWVSFLPSVGNPESLRTHLISISLAFPLTVVMVFLERYSIERGDIKDE